jgi:hypothetical protein
VTLVGAALSMKETETRNILLTEIASLSSRGESGRLQITAGTTRGAFFFKQGKLVDARMGPFTGFPAVNLAVSIGETRLSFDPSIQPPSSIFKNPKDRDLLRSRFGIDVLDAEETGQQPEATKVAEQILEAAPQGPRLETTSPGKTANVPNTDATEAITKSDDSAAKEFSSLVETSRFSTRAGPVPSILNSPQPQETPAAVSPLFPLGVKRSSRQNARAKLVLSACVIFLMVIAGAVGAASYWRRAKQTQSLETPLPVTAEGSLTPPSIHEAPKSIPTANAVPVERQTPLPNALVETEDAKARRSEVRDRIIKDSTNARSDDQNIEVAPVDKSPARTIEVVVQIEEGHVTEAYVQNPQAGLGAYEATALRIARERRYPRDTNRKQSLFLKVTGP